MGKSPGVKSDEHISEMETSGVCRVCNYLKLIVN